MKIFNDDNGTLATSCFQLHFHVNGEKIWKFDYDFIALSIPLQAKLKRFGFFHFEVNACFDFFFA